MTPFLSVVIPSYNEVLNLRRGVLDEVVGYLKQQDYTWEVILTDDGSTDGTVPELEAFASRHAHIKLLKNPHAGKGPTVQSGMLEATGEWRLFTDFDQSTPLSEIEKLWPYTKTKYQVVIGSRETAGAQRQAEPIHRHIMGRAFNLLVQLLAVPGILDTQCGFKLFSAAAAQKLFTSLYIYDRQHGTPDAFTGAFDVEVLFLARKNGYQIREVPINWYHHETNRVSAIKDSLRMFRDIVKIRLAGLQGKYRYS